MKKNFLLQLFAMLTALGLQAQVTQINSNKSLGFEYPISNSKTIYVSSTDSTIWVTDGSLGGTIQLSGTIKFVNSFGSTTFLNGKLIFAGTTLATGTEIFITDGTPGGTVLVSDIYPGPTSSSPENDFAILNGFIYFTAERPAEGLELWRTNGTPGGTSLVKDIVPGPVGSNNPGNYELFSTGTYLLFAARTPSSGIELWKSDGTSGGTNLLMDINTGNSGADSSNPKSFYLLNNIILFGATDATHGVELWRTDGTAGGTTLLKDINPGTASSGQSAVFPFFFHTFNNRAYFTANDGTSTGELWSTDGTATNTILLKNIVQGTFSFILLTESVNLANKFIFPVGDITGRSELWQSDGTPAGTVLFKAFTQTAQSFFPNIFVPYTIIANSTPTISQSLFQGNKFFFMANSNAEGNELWISDGIDATVAHTHIVRDINPGIPDGIAPTTFSYAYTSTAFYFPATNGTNGNELWKTDGTSANTSIVADIFPGAGSSNPNIAFYLVNGNILFEADNGDNTSERDLYAVDGSFTPLPVLLADFTVLPKSEDAVLNWHTSQEINSKDFTIQRSFDGQGFKNIATVAASGTSSFVNAYSFIDAGIMNSGNAIVYYRLLCADIDGKTTTSAVIALKIKNPGNWNVRLLTNPVNDNIKILLSGITQNVQVSIIDMSGKKIYTSLRTAANGQISLPAGTMPHGRYMLLTESGNERKIIQFIK